MTHRIPSDEGKAESLDYRRPGVGQPKKSLPEDVQEVVRLTEMASGCALSFVVIALSLLALLMCRPNLDAVSVFVCLPLGCIGIALLPISLVMSVLGLVRGCIYVKKQHMHRRRVAIYMAIDAAIAVGLLSLLAVVAGASLRR